MATPEQTLRELLDTLRAARRAEDVFGPRVAVADPVAARAALAERRTALLATLAPLAGGPLAARATLATALIHRWADEAERAIAAAPASAGPGATFSAGARRFELLRELPAGELCELFVVQETGTAAAPAVLKIARASANHDLLQREGDALSRLWGRSPEDVAVFGRYLPRPLAFLELDDGRCANLLSLADGYVSLAEVEQAYPRGVDARTLAWMFSRVLELLAWVHRQGVVHAAVLPAHVLVHPVTHGAVLVDWCYAVLDWRREPGAPHVSALVRAARRWYPPEVFARGPATPALDLYLAARTLIALAGGDPVQGTLPASVPREMADVLHGCLLDDPAARFDDAFALYERWRDVRLRVHGPARYHPFRMP